MKAYSIPECDLRQPGFLFLLRCVIALHLSKEIAAVLLLTDPNHVRVRNIAPRVIIVKCRRNKETNRLLDQSSNGFALLASDFLGTQGVDNDNALAGRDNSAIEAGR